VLQISTDYLVADHVEAITYHATTATQSDAGVLAVTDTSTAIAKALRRVLSVKEVEASGGRYRRRDVSWRIAQAELAARPNPDGDYLVDAGGLRWNVVDVKDVTLQSSWRAVTRR